jgi:hypothetical protein
MRFVPLITRPPPPRVMMPVMSHSVRQYAELTRLARWFAINQSSKNVGSHYAADAGRSSALVVSAYKMEENVSSELLVPPKSSSTRESRSSSSLYTKNCAS